MRRKNDFDGSKRCSSAFFVSKMNKFIKKYVRNPREIPLLQRSNLGHRCLPRFHLARMRIAVFFFLEKSNLTRKSVKNNSILTYFVNILLEKRARVNYLFWFAYTLAILWLTVVRIDIPGDSSVFRHFCDKNLCFTAFLADFLLLFSSKLFQICSSKKMLSTRCLKFSTISDFGINVSKKWIRKMWANF